MDEALHQARDELIAVQKLTFILRLNVYSPESFKPDNLVQVSTKHGTEKRSNWSSPRQVLSIYLEAGSFTVLGRDGKTLCAAVEDER